MYCVEYELELSCQRRCRVKSMNMVVRCGQMDPLINLWYINSSQSKYSYIRVYHMTLMHVSLSIGLVLHVCNSIKDLTCTSLGYAKRKSCSINYTFYTELSKCEIMVKPFFYYTCTYMVKIVIGGSLCIGENCRVE